MISRISLALAWLAQVRAHDDWVAPTWVGVALGILLTGILIGAVVVAVRALLEPPR